MLELTALGIDIFGGGFTIGVREAGFQVVGQWEECDAGRRTIDMNPKYFGRIQRPLRYEDWPFMSIPKINMLYANPPCAVWSSGNTRFRGFEQRMTDPRLGMTSRVMESALSIKPDFFVTESVPNAWNIGKSYYESWAQKFITLGYGVTFFLTDAMLHGSPSERLRFHFIAHRNALALEEPEMRNFMPRTVRHAMGDLNDRFGHLPQHMPRRITPEYAASIAEVEPGGKHIDVELARRERGEKPSIKSSFLVRRLVWDSPALTLIYMEATIHPSRSRFITFREGLRLGGYPDDFVIHSSKCATQAVLPPMGKYLGNLARATIAGHQPARRDLEFVDWRDLSKPYRQSSVLKSMKEEL